MLKSHGLRSGRNCSFKTKNLYPSKRMVIFLDVLLQFLFYYNMFSEYLHNVVNSVVDFLSIF